MAIPQIIKNLASKVRGAEKGSEVRESIAKSIEETANVADEANTRSQSTENRQTILENKYDEQLKDSDDVTEVKDAHVSSYDGQTYDTIGKRMDKVDADLAQNEQEISNRVVNHKILQGGQIPKPLRPPTINVHTEFPNKQSPYRIVLVDGETLYGYGDDLTFRKSTNGGKTWVKKGYNSAGFGSQGIYLRLEDGTLLGFRGTNTIQRSTDDGETWELAYKMRDNAMPLGTQSWCVDKTNGDIYLGEYGSHTDGTIALIRSQDNGETWEIFKEWGHKSIVGVETGVSHIHSVQWDPFAESIIVSIGDSTPNTGLWVVNDNRTDVVPLLLNSMIPSEYYDLVRTIGVMPFKNYIAFAGDSTQNPYLARVHRDELGKSKPNIERIYRLNSTAWFTCKASDDGSKWVITASEEGNSIDDLVHVYSVEDEGRTVWEVGTMVRDASSTSAAGSLQPLSTPEHGDDFWMITRQFGRIKTFKFRLGYGATQIMLNDIRPNVPFKQTVSGGLIKDIPPGEEIVFGMTVAGGFARRMHIFESSIGLIDSGSSGAGALKVLVRKKDDNAFYSSTNYSQRYSGRDDMADSITSEVFSGGNIVEFVIQNNSPGGTVTLCNPYVVFGWGLESP